jgi:hypothetical protein
MPSHIVVTSLAYLSFSFITTMAPIEQIVVGKYSAANKDDYCKFTLTPAIQKKENSIPLMAAIEGKIDGLQTRDFILKYKQTVGDQVIASREISRTTVGAFSSTYTRITLVCLM